MPLVPGFSIGDAVTLTFTKPTNTPPVPAVFSHSLGALAWSWPSADTAVATVLDAGGDTPIATSDVDIGLLTLRVVGVTALGGTAASASPGDVDVSVSGTWGAPSRPRVVRACAIDSGNNTGLASGDGIAVQFDQNVTIVDVSTPAAVASVLLLSHGLSGVVDRGRWLDNRTLLVVFGDGVSGAGGGGGDGLATAAASAGVLTVSVLPSGGVYSAISRSSGACNDTAVLVACGSFGDVPVVALLFTTSTTIRVTLSPPRPVHAYPVTRFYVRWCDVHATLTNGTSTGGNTTANGTSSSGTATPASAIDGPAFAWALPLASASNTSANATGGVVAVTVSDTATGSGGAVTTAWYARSSPTATGCGAAVVTALNGAALSPSSTVTVDVGNLTARHTYAVHARCNIAALNDNDGVGPLVPSTPAEITPLPPLLTSLSTSPMYTIPALADRR